MNIKKIAIRTAYVVIFIVISSIILSFIFGTEEDNKPDTTSTNSREKEDSLSSTDRPIKATDINSTVSAWKAAGLDVSDAKNAFYQFIGASNGSKYDVDETNVELYEFSDSGKADDAKASNFSSDSYTVLVVNKLLVLIHSTDPSQVDPIKAVF